MRTNSAGRNTRIVFETPDYLPGAGDLRMEYSGWMVENHGHIRSDKPNKG
jgi:hypothetical protein